MVIEINGWNVKEVAIKSTELTFDKDGKKTLYTDSKGVKVTKVRKQASKYVWHYEDGTEYTEKAFKNINGKPVKEFAKTKVAKYEIISSSITNYFIQNELTYMLVSPELKSMLKELAIKQQCITFKYVNRGFKVHKAVAVYDEELDRVIMRLFRGDMRKSKLD